MFIAKMIVSSILMAEIAKTKFAKKGTEIHAEIGMKKDAREKKVVHTCTKTHMIQEKDMAVETEIIVTQVVKVVLIAEDTAEKEVTAEEVAEKEVTAEERVDTEVPTKEIAEKEVTGEDTAEKEVEAEESTEEGVKATKVTLKAAMKKRTKLKKVLRDSWSRPGLYWHTSAGVVRSRDMIYVRNGGSSNLVAQET